MLIQLLRTCGSPQSSPQPCWDKEKRLHRRIPPAHLIEEAMMPCRCLGFRVSGLGLGFRVEVEGARRLGCSLGTLTLNPEP